MLDSYEQGDRQKEKNIMTEIKHEMMLDIKIAERRKYEKCILQMFDRAPASERHQGYKRTEIKLAVKNNLNSCYPFQDNILNNALSHMKQCETIICIGTRWVLVEPTIWTPWGKQ